RFLPRPAGKSCKDHAILGVAAKLERRRTLERTARGLADAKAEGVKFGRKSTLTPHQQSQESGGSTWAGKRRARCPQLQRQSADDFASKGSTGNSICRKLARA